MFLLINVLLYTINYVGNEEIEEDNLIYINIFAIK